jgi:hypothetical protein
MKLTPELVSSSSQALLYFTEKPSSAFSYDERDPETLVVSETATGIVPLAMLVGAEAPEDRKDTAGEAVEE